MVLGIGPFGQPKLAQDNGPLPEEPIHYGGITPRLLGPMYGASCPRDLPRLID